MSEPIGATGIVVRIARVAAREGLRDDLVRAAHGNTNDALANGALTAEVCADPNDDDTFLVISRWPSMTVLKDFLAWHETQAHESMADYSQGKPTAAHHRVV